MSYDDEGQLQIPTNYIAALSRFKYYLILGVLGLAAISAVVVSLIPAVYRSEAIVLVETQQIPDELVRSTVTSIAAERIQIIKQRVMTRDKLLGIAKDHPSLKDSVGSVLVSDLVIDMRDKITVDLITGNTGSRNKQATTIAFKVAFDALSPSVAQSVANDLVTLFLDENVKARTERATETTDFLRTEANKLKRKLSDTEQAIADYKQKYKDALPEHLDLYMSMLERAQNSRVEIQRQAEAERNQRSFYEVQLTSSTESQAERSKTGEIYAEYERLSAIYQENHPDLIRLKDEIASLEKSKTPSANVANLIEQKIAATNSQIRLLSQQLSKTTQQIQELETKILKIPQVERGLLALNRDYVAVKSQYDEIVSNTMQAQMAESLEQGRKAERFSILEPPLLPDQPFKPDRKKLLAAGFAASFSIPLALVLGLAFLDKSVRGAAAVEAVTGHVPLVVIPVITTPAEDKRRKSRIIKAILALLLLFGGGVLLVHFMVMPLDMILYKLMYKFGL